MNFSDEDIYAAVKHHLPLVNEYVAFHGGAIKLLGTHNGKIYIELTGACHGCAMSLMTTKMVVQKQLRELIHPELVVVHVGGTAENALLETYYTEAEEEIKKTSLWDKVKQVFANASK